MAGVINEPHVLWDVSLVVNSVDLSDHARKVEIVVSTTKHPRSPFGTLKDYSMPGLLQVNDPKIEFWQDYAASKVYATIYAAWLARTIFNVVAKASSAARSPTNPEWTLPVFVSETPILSGEKGKEHMAAVTLTMGGEFSVATA